MKKNQITAQMYTTRDYIRNLRDFDETCQKLSNIGFKCVQLSGWNTDLDMKEIKKIYDDNGLKCIVTHHSSDLLLKETNKIVDDLNILDCKYTAYPYPAGKMFRTANQVNDFIDELANAGKILKENGKQLLYHNHHYEFAKVEGEIVLDTIFNKIPKDYLQGEIDTYWVQAGGQCPVKWAKKLQGYMPIIHMKDYAVKLDDYGNVKTGISEIGVGNIDWKEIVNICDAGGTEYYVIEQDENFTGTPFDSLKISYDYIANNLCED